MPTPENEPRDLIQRSASSPALLNPDHLKYPWDKQSYESDQEYALFRVYLDYGPGREGSYERISKRTGEHDHKLRQISEKNQWYPRGEAYQEYIKTILDAYSDERRESREAAIVDDLDAMIDYAVGRMRTQILEEGTDAATPDEWIKRLDTLAKTRKNIKSNRKEREQAKPAPRNIIMAGTLNMNAPPSVTQVEVFDVVDAEEEEA